MSKAKFEFGIDSRQLGLYFGIDSMLHVKGEACYFYKGPF